MAGKVAIEEISKEFYLTLDYPNGQQKHIYPKLEDALQKAADYLMDPGEPVSDVTVVEEPNY